jgi:hypothetical protein
LQAFDAEGMSMSATLADRDIVSLAHGMGYFPTAAQAREIDRLAAEKYLEGLRHLGEPRGDKVDEGIFAACVKWAAERVMGGNNSAVA